ncbi:unnamed protein product [Symbiodinium natans]|uniref:Uncharacterized protein n=1 Tax=Symbiodinium natans TaxID=878477 RepID=A0A812KFK9_9DINO|nr:unnamed protein product [Symbiodinium natans]
MPGYFHPSLSVVILVLLPVPALHRAGTFSSGKFDVRDISLHMLFPSDYSAFGLAKEQRPARWFITSLVLLRVGSFLSCYPLIYAARMFPDFFAEGALFADLAQQNAAQQSAAQQNAAQQNADTDMSHTLSLAFGLGISVFICGSCCGCCFLSRCFCVGNVFSGAAEADLALQERVEERASVLSEQMRKSELKPTWTEYVMLHVDMMSFAADFVSDGLLAWKFFELGMYGFFAFQMAIILITLWEESRVVRKLGSVHTVYHAVAESSSRGWPTDNLLAILMQEKLIEATPSMLLVSVAYFYFPQSESQSTRRLFGYDITLVVGLYKMVTGTYGAVKAAYVLMHLDLDRHVAVAVEGLGSPSAPSSQHSSNMPAQPSQAPQIGHRPPAQLVGPAEFPARPPGIMPRPVAPTPAFPPGIVPPPAAPTPSAPFSPKGGLEHKPAQESPPWPVAVPMQTEERPAETSASLRLSMPPLPPIQVGAPRGAVDHE